MGGLKFGGGDCFGEHSLKKEVMALLFEAC